MRRQIAVARGLQLLLASALTLIASTGYSWSQQMLFIAQPQSEAADIRARMTDLADPKAKIPEEPTLLGQEYNRIDQEISKYSIYATSTDNNGPILLTTVDRIISDMGKFTQEITSLDCKQIDKYKSLNDLLLSASYALSSVLPTTSQMGTPLNVDLHTFWSLPGARGPPTDQVGWLSDCQETKRIFHLPNTAATITQSLNQIRADADDKIKKQGELRELATKLLPLLRERRAALQAKITSSSPQQQVASYLWIIMLVIGGSGVLTMIVVRMFSEPLQMEWVASGQVIQFVTVMILLSVIMALGLSGILKENTLGTLLGGIAGYILAQGVGAAAREASRRPPQVNPQQLPGGGAQGGGGQGGGGQGGGAQGGGAQGGGGQGGGGQGGGGHSGPTHGGA